MLDTNTRVEFLKTIHLFIGLSDLELVQIASELQELSVEQGGIIYTEGNPADSMQIVFQGLVKISRLKNSQEMNVTALVRGEYYGGEGLSLSTTREFTATADPGTIVLILFRTSLERLLKKIPALHNNIEIILTSRRLAQKLNFDWLAENEFIYYLERKHTFLLFQELSLPFLFLLPIFGFLTLAFIFNSSVFGMVGGFLFVINLLWGIWRYVDWGNDYYIVTNQRVIWLEKVIALYDSRTEASMDTILSVDYDTSYIGRILAFGTVIVRTFTGQIRMNFIRHPSLAAAMIEDYWGRSKNSSRKADEETIQETLRKKLGLVSIDSDSIPTPETVTPAVPYKPTRQSPLSAWWNNAFRMRTIEGTTITYHKHILGFVRDASPYAVGIISLVFLVIIWPFIFDYFVPLWLSLLIISAVIILFGYIGYEYLDWLNDIYQVTSDQIIDIYRKPFSTEDRKTAPLENILSTEYKRNGLIGILFNFGTVYIMVGTLEFNFEDVFDPPSVQQDIIRRQQAWLKKKTDGEIAAERERMADWLSVYHRTVNDANQTDLKGTPPKPE